MERNSLMSTGFKANSTVIKSSPIKESSSGKYSRKNSMMKEAIWDCNSMRSNAVEEDYMNGFSWPPRSYTCSFCKREFRSAQALGGHMNVHRRDRARLRQSPPTSTDAQAPMLNLNPNFPSSSLSLLSSFSSSTTRLKPYNCTLPSLVCPPTLLSSSPPPSSASSSHELKRWAVDGILLNPLNKKAPESSTKLKNERSLSGFGEYDHVLAREDGCKILKKAEIIRLDLEIGLLSDSKDDLDLELRLGTLS